MKKSLLLLCFLAFLSTIRASEDYALTKDTLLYPETNEGLVFAPKQLIVPGTLIALGIYGTIDGRLDEKIRNQVVKWNGNTMIDDVTVFIPGISIYLLDWCGVHSKHNLLDKTVIAATSAIITVGTTQLLKSTIQVKRPDGSGDDSFPSMHTAVAFAGAELLWQEYGDRSVWYGIAGYSVATATGFLRIYNDKHWFSDVLAGAGIGILGTKAAYWLYPSIRNVFNKKGNNDISVFPYGSSVGFGLNVSFQF